MRSAVCSLLLLTGTSRMSASLMAAVLLTATTVLLTRVL
jgi:hypothetical protein